MGYMRHHAIIVSSFSEDAIERALKSAMAFGLGDLTSPVVRSRVNGYSSFLIAPDGSKEYWGDSDEGDQQRESFIEWLDKQRYDDGSSLLSWVEVQYGDDEGEVRITRDSDEARREKK